LSYLIEGKRSRRGRGTAVQLAAAIVGVVVLTLAGPDLGGRADDRASRMQGRGGGPPGDAPERIHRPVTATQRAAGVYAGAATTRVPEPVAHVPERVYVPNSDAGTVDVIDAKRLKVIRRFAVGALPHHITPGWDLKRLYVTNTVGNSLTVIDPRKGRPVATLPIEDPYNLYFTPDGSRAVVVAERMGRLDFRDRRSWRLKGSVPVPWRGVDHLDFSADGRYLLASAEFSGAVVKVDVRRMKLTGTAVVGGLPVDVEVSPDGRVFYVTNQGRSGVSVIDPVRMKEIAFLRTGVGAHGLAISRDGRSLYVSNRMAGSISVIDLRRRRVRATWQIGGSPDMLQVSPDGRRLWVSGRYAASVYVVDTRRGRLVATIPAGAGAHGLTYFPQPGRFSVGHNGVYR
jgi:YVTN family beta-propeller protein